MSLASELAALCARHGVALEVERAPVLLEPSLDLVAPVLPDAGVDLRAMLARAENHLIVQALERTAGNRNRAAALLRLHRTTLVMKLKLKLDTDPHFRTLWGRWAVRASTEETA